VSFLSRRSVHARIGTRATERASAGIGMFVLVVVIAGIAEWRYMTWQMTAHLTIAAGLEPRPPLEHAAPPTSDNPCYVKFDVG